MSSYIFRYIKRKIIFAIKIYKAKIDFLLDSIFAKMVKKDTCDKYDEYTTLSEASFVCASNDNCESVYDTGCNGGIFYLCSINSVEVTTSGSCLYLKPGVFGKYS